MAKSTFLQLCQATNFECNAQASLTLTPTAVLNQLGELRQIVTWVADTDVEIQGLWFDWDFLHESTWSANTAIGVAAVSAPSDIGSWDEDSFYLNYTLSTNKKLTPLDYKLWRSAYRQGVQTNKKPDSIVVMPNQSLKLEPAPDAIYSLSADYYKRPVKMTADANTSPIPEEYERIIVHGAIMKYAAEAGAPELFAPAQAAFQSLMDKLEAKYLPNQSGRRMADAGQMTVRTE